MEDVCLPDGQEGSASDIRHGGRNDAKARSGISKATFLRQLGGVPPTRSVPIVVTPTAVRSVDAFGTSDPGCQAYMRQPVNWSRGLPQNLTAQSVDQEDDNPGMRTEAINDAQQMPDGNSGNITAIWPPLTVVHEDRGKATAVWVLLLAVFVGYVVYLSVSSIDSRKKPPVQIIRKDEPFNLPDVVFCPSSGDGCDSNNEMDCLPMHWAMSALEGLLNCDDYFMVPPSTPPTPSPTSLPTSSSSASYSYYDDDLSSSSYSSSWSTSGYTESSFSTSPTGSVTPSPVALPAILLNLETRAQEWCPRVPLSKCTIDYDGVESGDVRSLHASFYVMWNDMPALDPVTSTRRFINMFFVDVGEVVTDAVVAARLPYDRVTISGTEAFTFSSNDVVLRMSQYVHLDSNGNTGSTERTYTQATTTAEHTLRLEAFEGRQYEGALLYVTLSINDFVFQSIEEVDPVDGWALLGAVGGVWEIVCVMFGVFFVAKQASGPDKTWSWKKAMSGDKERRAS